MEVTVKSLITSYKEEKSLTPLCSISPHGTAPTEGQMDLTWGIISLPREYQMKAPPILQIRTTERKMGEGLGIEKYWVPSEEKVSSFPPTINKEFLTEVPDKEIT